MNTGARVALAVGAGYVLGRRKKLRPALTLAAAVAVGRASHNAPSLIKYGTDLLSSSPAAGNLGKMGKPLATAGKAAATAAIGSGVDALSDRLRDRADALRHPKSGEPEEPEAKRKSRGRSARDAEDNEEPDEEPESWDDEAEDTGYDEDETAQDEATGPDAGARRRGGTADRTPARATSGNTRRGR